MGDGEERATSSGESSESPSVRPTGDTTLKEISNMRVHGQRLLAPFKTPVDAIRHMTCTQAQDFQGSTASIALRTAGRSITEVHNAYNAGSIVRSWPMRGTLFAVAAEDLGWMLSLTAEKVLHQTTKRREDLGLDADSLRRARDVAVQNLSQGPMTRTELLTAWENSKHSVAGGRGYHSLFHLAVSGVLCLGPMHGNEQCFVLRDTWISHSKELPRDEAIALWFTRYVNSHGPVTVADFLWWTKLLVRDLAPLIPRLRTQFEILTVAREEYWASPAAIDAYLRPGGSTAATLLLPGFDELVLGYGDRKTIVSKQHESQIVPGNNGVFQPTIVRAGRALATWKRPTKIGAPVEISPFEQSLPASTVRSVERLWERFPKH
jgi:hypothetical protein